MASLPTSSRTSQGDTLKFRWCFILPVVSISYYFGWDDHWILSMKCFSGISPVTCNLCLLETIVWLAIQISIVPATHISLADRLRMPTTSVKSAGVDMGFLYRTHQALTQLRLSAILLKEMYHWVHLSAVFFFYL